MYICIDIHWYVYIYIYIIMYIYIYIYIYLFIALVIIQTHIIQGGFLTCKVIPPLQKHVLGRLRSCTAYPFLQTCPPNMY